MSKKIMAVTNINAGPGKFVAAGDEVNPAALELDVKALRELHDAGAIEVVTVEEVKSEEPTPASSEVETEQNTGEGTSQPGEQ